ncbi:hypothetical protein THAOC_02417, partial [Thalassiosira oceanica]
MSQTAARGGGRKGSSLPGRPCFRDAAMHTVAIVPLDVPRGKTAAARDRTRREGRRPTASGPSPTSSPPWGGSPAPAARRTSAARAEASPLRRRRPAVDRGVERDHARAAPLAADPAGGLEVRRHPAQEPRLGQRLPEDAAVRRQAGHVEDGARPPGRGPGDSFDDPWMDLEPHRCTSAVVGILNMKDCRSTADLWRAEESLVRWARR